MADGGSFAHMTAFTPDQDSQRAFRDALGAFAPSDPPLPPLVLRRKTQSESALDPPTQRCGRILSGKEISLPTWLR